MNDLQNKIIRLFDKSDMLFGFTKIEDGQFKETYRSAFIFAVPYTHQLSLKNYREEIFNDGILGAKRDTPEK